AIDPGWLRALGYEQAHRPMFGKLPERRVERWRLVEEFIGTWYRPLAPSDGVPEEELEIAERRLGFKIPAALREWYGLAGSRHDVWSTQDHFASPSELHIRPNDNALIFHVENQACESWGIRADDLSLDDPAVFCFVEPAQVSPATS